MLQSRRVWAWRIAKLLVLAALIWGVRRTLLGTWHELQQRSWQLDPLWAVACGVLYLLGLLPNALYWRRILTLWGQPTPLAEALSAYYISHLGKYVPGKALVLVLRAALLRQRSVDPAAVSLAVFYETLTFFATGSTWALILLGLGFRQETTLLAAAALLIAVTLLPIWPGLVPKLVTWLGLSRARYLAATTRRVEWPTLALGWVMLSASWVLMALSLGAALAAVGASGGLLAAGLPRLMISITLAMGLGFLSFLPAGAVVRELVILHVLATQVGEAPAALAALVIRIVWLLSELLTSAILYVAIRPAATHPREPAATGDSP